MTTPDDDDDDPWLRQFLRGQEAKEQRSKETGWGCAITMLLAIIAVAILLAH